MLASPLGSGFAFLFSELCGHFDPPINSDLPSSIWLCFFIVDLSLRSTNKMQSQILEGRSKLIGGSMLAQNSQNELLFALFDICFAVPARESGPRGVRFRKCWGLPDPTRTTFSSPAPKMIAKTHFQRHDSHSPEMVNISQNF